MVSFASFPSDKRSSTIGGPITYGPWGGSGGTIFDDGIYTGIRQINLTRNVGITSLKVKYDRNGQEVWGNKNGGSGGIINDKVIQVAFIMQHPETYDPIPSELIWTSCFTGRI